MPFNRTNMPPSTNSKVTVTFTGLMLLKPAADDSCEIGIHRFNTTHLFQVILVVYKPDRPPRLIRLLSGPLTDTFEMSVTPTPTTRFQAFAASEGDFDRSDVSNDPLDYRWSFNMRSVHPNADFNNGAKPVATLNAGVLYTPNLTREGLTLELVRGDTALDEFPRIGADLAAAIELPPRSKMKIKWNELGDPQFLELPRDTDPEGTTYTIALLNDPPISSPVIHDELALFYKVLQEEGGGPIESGDKCRLDVPDSGKTDEIPCLPIILD